MRSLRGALVLAAVVLSTVAPSAQTPALAAGKQQVVRCGGCWPAAFAFTPDGAELFYVERFSGEIRHVPLAGGPDQRWGKIKGVAGGGERGALGLALDPDWAMGPDHQWVYVYYTDAHPEVNRIVRLRQQGGGTEIQQLARIPANSFHDGGVIHFGPDGKLYAVTGGRREPGPGPGAEEPRRKGPPARGDRRPPARQPHAREQGVLVRPPKLVRVRVRSPDREAVADGERPHV